jgi:hypothetical protein
VREHDDEHDSRATRQSKRKLQLHQALRGWGQRSYFTWIP